MPGRFNKKSKSKHQPEKTPFEKDLESFESSLDLHAMADREVVQRREQEIKTESDIRRRWRLEREEDERLEEKARIDRLRNLDSDGLRYELGRIRSLEGLAG